MEGLGKPFRRSSSEGSPSTEGGDFDSAEVRAFLRYKFLFQGARDIILFLDVDGHIIDANDAAARAYGYTREELLSLSVRDLRASHGAPTVREQMLMADSEGILFETIHRRKDGSIFPVEVSSQGVDGEVGRVLLSIVRDITSRKAAEAERERMADHLQTILASTGEGIYGIDAEGICTFANRSAVQQLGFAPEEIVGRRVHDLVHHHRLDGTPYPVEDCPIVLALKEGKAVRVEGEVFWHKDGTPVPVYYSSFPMVDGESVRGAVVVFTDVTERQRAEMDREALLAEMERQAVEMNAIFLSLSNGVIVYDMTGKPVRANPAAVSSYGFDPVGLDRSELDRRLDIRHLNGRPTDPRELASSRALQGETVHGMVFRFTRSDGQELITIASASPLMVKGKRAGAVVVWQDVTERERLLKEMEELATMASRRVAELHSILDTMVDAVLVSDRQGRITLVNNAAVRLLNLPEQRYLAKSAISFNSIGLQGMDGKPFDPEELPMARAMRGEDVALDDAVLQDPETGQKVYVRISAAPIRNEQGEIDGAVAVARDVSALTELDRLKDQFISVAAHELKTPVAIMKGYAQLLLRKPSADSSQRRALEAIDRGSDRIDHVVNDLLDISRLHAGYLELTRERLDLAHLLEQVVARVHLDPQNQMVRIVGADPALVVGDRDRLEQVLVNLIDNAVRYSPGGGPVDVSLQVRGRRAVVSVKDRGVGIPREKQRRIFENFFRAHTGTPYDYGGMGVGLYISREIIARHGGEMWFESEEGRGSQFHFSLPLEGNAF